MSEKEKKNAPQEEQPQANTTPETEQAAEKTVEEETFTVTREQMEQMEQLAKMVSDASDKYLRLAAEYDNYRKRMVKEKEECAKFANQRLLEELLPVIDNFEMGMAAASADASSMIYVGMSMVKKQLDEFLASNGVQALDPVVGSMFDHATEEAIQREPSDQPEGTVLRVIRKGYTLKDRLLRPANVVVAHAPEPEPEV